MEVLTWRKVGSKLLMVSWRMKAIMRLTPVERARTEGRVLDDDSIDVDGEDEDADEISEESEENEADVKEVKALRVSCPACMCVFQDVI
jgi:hypothetical protein